MRQITGKLNLYNLHLRARIVLLVIAAGIPTLLLVLYMALMDTGHTRADLERESRQIALIFSARQMQLLESSRHVLESLSNVPQVRGGSAAECSIMLSEIRQELAEKEVNYFENIGVIMADGRLWASALPVAEETYLGDRTYFKRAIRDGGFVIGDFRTGRVTGRQTVNVACQVKNNAGIADRVIFAALSAEALTSGISGDIVPEEVLLLVVDSRGTIVSARSDKHEWIGRSIKGTSFDSMLAMRSASGERIGDDFDGVERQYSFMSVYENTDGPVYFIVGVPLSASVNNIRGRALVTLLLLLLVFSLAACAAWFGGWLLVEKPIAAIALAMKKIACGDFSARSGVESCRGEFSQLATAFDEMADSLEQITFAHHKVVNELQQYQQDVQQMVERVQLGIFRINLETGTFIRANTALARIAGFESGGQLVGRNADDILVSTTGSIYEDLKQNDLVRDREYILRLPDGGEQACSVSAAVQRERECIDGIVEDVGGKKQAERDRLTLEQHLLHSQKMGAIGLLAGGIAHDFNNILQVISGSLEMISLEESLSSEGTEDLQNIRRVVSRAAELTSKLLLFSRRQAMKPMVVDVNELVNDVMKMVSRLIGENIALEIETQPEMKTIVGDAGQLEQVLVNICINARDAMPDGGKLSIQTRRINRDSTLSAFLRKMEEREGRSFAAEEYIQIMITDNGSGMDQVTMSRIFEPFFTTKTGVEGAGMGLAISYGIIKEHRGLISVQSDVGQGTTFRILLPVEEPEEDESDESTFVREPAGGRRVLLAEDDPDVRNLAVRFLESAGYRVSSVEDGVKAIALVQSEPEGYDIALLDVMMPHAGGLKVRDAIREVGSDIPVVFVSGYSEQVDDLRRIQQQGDLLLQKPYTREDLLQIMVKVSGNTAG